MLDDLSTAALVASFGGAAVVIGFAGTRLTRRADQLADRLELGEALVGAAILGGITSLPGIVTSVAAASGGAPDLSIANALGGIAAQTMFLALADMFYRRANLEHAAASVPNMLQGTLLLVLLLIPILAWATPEVALWGVHPATVALVAAYTFGLRMTSAARHSPMWGPEHTVETRSDIPEHGAHAHVSTTRMAVQIGVFGALIGTAGYVVAVTGEAMSARFGVPQTVVGALMTGVVTSLPELVTTIAAVRQGALTLAVGGVIGGNSFDVLFLAFSDVAYRDGSLYHVMHRGHLFTLALGLLMTVVLLMGLLRRERHGVGNIGFESALLLVLYAGGVATLLLTGAV